MEFPTAVVPLVEVLDLGDQVLQLRRQRDENLLAAPGPRPGVQDFNVHAVRCRNTNRFGFFITAQPRWLSYKVHTSEMSHDNYVLGFNRNAKVSV